ncbi:MAG: FAD-dependent oxidoreductase [Planctomycetes bacterium]|nr:FAD-dependent oxidoreductase [Planctomycetota bacterium]
MPTFRRIYAFILAALPLTSMARAEPTQHDIVIYGATPSGIIAAVAAARDGRSVLVLEPTDHIGGMTTGGLSSTDIGNPIVIGGLAHEFFQRAAASYHDPERLKGRAIFYSEPHVAMAAFKDMLDEAHVEVRTHQRLDRATMHDHRLTAVMMLDGSEHAARMFIDASYEGDLMAKANVSYIVGRESSEQYGEPLAGFHPAELRPRTVEEMALDDPDVASDATVKAMHYVHGTPTKISPYDEDGKLLPGINGGAWPAIGSADRKIMGYNFRVIVTRAPGNRLPWPKPAHYDVKQYELLRRVIAAYPGIRFSKLVHLAPIPNGKFDANNIGMIVGTNLIGENYGYPDGDWAMRDRIWQAHVDYVQGVFWFLAHDERLPADLRDEANQWGLCKDEFIDNDHWPYALYIRVARRMIGDYVMTQTDVQKQLTKSDAIGMGSFICDSHAVQRLIHPDGYVIDEGNFDVPTRPYEIAYRSLTPRKGECDNLLVSVCMSASYVAYGSIRMEPQYMIMGHAAGLAASQAIARDTAAQDIDIAALQAKLRAQKQIVTLADAPGAAALLIPLSGGLIVDDGDAALVGDWQGSSFARGYQGGYLHDRDASKGHLSATYTFAIDRAGEYEARFVYVPYPNRATNVPITIESADGTKMVKINEREKPPIDGAAVSLGRFHFAPGKPAIITIRNDHTDGYVAVDAVQLLPVE